MVFIRIKIKGYLKNNTDNEIHCFEEKGIINKNRIIYSYDGVKFSIRINNNELILVREGIDFINTFVFSEKKSNCNYYLKENNYDVDIEVKTIKMNISTNNIYVKYLVLDSNCEYEYNLEMSDI